MAGMTLEELQANKPTADDEVYDQARAAAVLAGALAELANGMRRSAGHSADEKCYRVDAI